MTTKFYYSVSYSIRNGEPETAYAFSCRSDLKEENTERNVRKIFVADSEKEAEKAATSYAKSHNKKVREFRAKVKAELIAKKEAKKAEKVSKKEAIKTRIAQFISPEIKKIVAVLFEKQKQNVLESLTSQYNHILKLLKEIEGVSPQDEKYKKLFDTRYYGRTEAHRLSDGIMEHKKDAKSKYEGTWKHDYPLFFKAGYNKIIDKMIQDDLKSIMDSFLAKMEAKLGEVIKSKTIKEFVSQGLHNGFVSFTFSDGSSFLLSNSIEYGTSKYGVSFQRFPCRFHNVHFSNGKIEKWVSEDQMKKEF